MECAQGLRIPTHILFWVLTVVLVLAILGVVHKIWYQGYAIKHFVPVRAIVLGKHVERSRTTTPGGSTTSYKVCVEYEYYVGDVRYTCDRIGPLRGLGPVWSLQETYEAYKQFHEGQSVTAYYDPRNPNRAYLIPDYDTSRYLGVYLFFGLLVLLTAVYMEVPYHRRHAESFYDQMKNSYRWRPLIRFRVHFWQYMVLAGIWNVLAIGCLAHYLSMAGEFVNTNGVVILGCFEIIGLVLLGAILWAKLTGSRESEVSVLRPGDGAP